MTAPRLEDLSSDERARIQYVIESIARFVAREVVREVLEEYFADDCEARAALQKTLQ